MKQDTLKTIIRNSFEEGWRERNKRLNADGSLANIPVDDKFVATQKRVTDFWIAELTKDTDL